MGQIIQSGLNMVGAYNNGVLQQGFGAAQHTINDANTYATNTEGQAYADATNAVRTAQNNVAAATASLSDTMTSIKNQQTQTRYGQASNTLNENLARSAEAMTRGSIDQRLAASEQTGALRAAISNSGTGGATSAQLLSSLNIQQSRAQQLTADQTKQKTYDGLLQQSGLQQSRSLSYDFSQSIAGINNAQAVYTPVVSPIVAQDFAASPTEQAVSSFFGGDWTKTAQQASTLFGGQSTGSGSSSYSPTALSYGPVSYEPSSSSSSYTSYSGTGSNSYNFEGSSNPFTFTTS